MRFITISAAILLGSAMSAAGAQQLSPTGPTKPSSTKAGALKDAINAANQPTGGSGSQFVVSGAAETCAGATAIAGPGNYIGDNIGSADVEEADIPCRAGTAEANDVWYQWTAMATGSTSLSMCPAFGGGATADFDTLLTVWNTSACVGANLACNDDGPGCTGAGTYQSTTSFAATSGNVYKIQIAGWNVAEEGTFNLRINAPVGPPANDNCVNRIAISGPGPFAGTTVAATTDGPVPTACAGSGAGQDVWYNWTATTTGSTIASLCAADGGSATYDSTLVVYDGTACPPVTQIACNDDFCGVQSKVTFAATGGSVYKIRVAGFGTATGTFSLVFIPAPPPVPGDACSLPLVYPGGIIPWSNVGMTTDGGAESCGTPQQDVWYTWNSNCTGSARLSLCPGGLTPDTVVAVYAGLGCPTPGSAIGCDDDFCSAPAFGTSSAAFCATLGQDYMLRIGGFGTTTGSGLFEVTPCSPNPPEGGCVVFHDGSTEAAVGTNNTTHDILWIHSQGEAGQSTVVKSISTAWGSLAAVGVEGPPNFAPGRVGIWSDPNGDGDPTDAVLLQEVPVAIAGSETDALQNVPLSPDVFVTGKYFIGASCSNALRPAPLDQSSGSCPGGKAWIVGSTVGAIDYTNLAGEEIPPLDENNVAPGYWLLEAVCKDTEITEICGVVASSTAECPCGAVPAPPNSGTIGWGCPHSGDEPGGGIEGELGSHLEALAGSNPLIGAGDTVNVMASNVRQGNHAASLFISGDAEHAPTPFDDGLVCSSTNLRKLWIWKDPITPAGGGGEITSQTGPGPNTIPPTTSLSQAEQDANGGVALLNGQTRIYWMIFRDPAAGQGCPGLSTRNTTNALRILWSEVGP